MSTYAGPYDPRAVANTFLDLALDAERTVTHLKMQKLVYIAHGWNLVVNERPLVKDDVEAWRHGPVYRRMYHTFKKHGGRPINQYFRDFSATEVEAMYPRVPKDTPEFEVVEEVWDAYGRFSARELSAMTHREDSPWDRTMRANGKDATIDDELIREHYENLAYQH
jgi:uncharacterized phage-associated protein